MLWKLRRLYRHQLPGKLSTSPMKDTEAGNASPEGAVDDEENGDDVRGETRRVHHRVRPANTSRQLIQL